MCGDGGSTIFLVRRCGWGMMYMQAGVTVRFRCCLSIVDKKKVSIVVSKNLLEAIEIFS